ncbi:unnamed protein product [Medioppia subpectinata]|uniref:Nuclear receptor domain-containing protein n=1 Tax=Medioppia subpectinata TaxID=1979941 RepID=A0A7R9KV74_9ACAR|nr:unnamed protein product [Medioppia subpectinata]CAG2110487.1 unnamed protein product [Medioppia subpectinata]
MNVNKMCSVCGHNKGVGRNYCAITCESCKMFFKRTALKNQTFDCPSGGKCKINAITRKLCTKCRIEKCCAVGMRKELLKSYGLVDVDREYNTSTNESSPQSAQSDDNNCHEIDILLENTINTSAEELMDQIRDIENYVTNNIFVASDKQLPQMPVIPVFRELIDYKGLNQLECNRMRELMTASDVFKRYELGKNIVKSKDKDVVTKLFMPRTEAHIRDVINFTKGLKAFVNVCPDDQLALIKYSFMEVGYVYPEWERDPIILELLTAIIIFNPKHPDLSHRASIKLEQQIYIYLLRKYLQLKCRSQFESELRLQTLMNSMTDLKIAGDLHREDEINEYHNYKPYYGPLLKELYGL